MNNDLRSRVLIVAKHVRQWTQDKANRTRYNPHNLCGWCAISAAHLFRELRRKNIDVELHYVRNHCFTVVDDYVVDVTATQFVDFEDVEINILHYKEAQEYRFYNTEKIFTTPTQLRDHQLRTKWPTREICYTR
jgi:hypothetical protein